MQPVLCRSIPGIEQLDGHSCAGMSVFERDESKTNAFIHPLVQDLNTQGSYVSKILKAGVCEFDKEFTTLLQRQRDGTAGKKHYIGVLGE